MQILFYIMELIVRKPMLYNPDLYFKDEDFRRKIDVAYFFKEYGTLPTQEEIKNEIYFISNFDMETPATKKCETEMTRFYLQELVQFFLNEMKMKNFVQVCPDLAMYTLIGFLECAGILRRYEEQTYNVLNKKLGSQIRTEDSGKGYLKTYTINGVTHYKGFLKEYTPGYSAMPAQFISDYEVDKYLNRDHYMKRMDFKNLYRVLLATFHKSTAGNVIIEMYPHEYSTGFYSLETIFEMCEIEINTFEPNKQTSKLNLRTENAKSFDQQLRELKEISLYLQPTQWETTNWEQEQSPPF